MIIISFITFINSYIQISKKKANLTHDVHQQNRSTRLVSFSIPLSQPSQRLEHSISRQRLQHAGSANERAQRGRETNNGNTNHGNPRPDANILEDRITADERVVREDKGGEGEQDGVVGEGDANRDDRTTTEIAAGILKITGQVGTFHDSSHGWEDNAEDGLNVGHGERSRHEKTI